MSARALRLAVAGAFALSSIAAGGALAAPAKSKPKPVCNLISDAKDDTFAVRSQDSQGAYGPQEDALDLVSGDLASDGKVLTAVLRVKKMALTAGTSPNGLSFRVQFTHGGLDEDTNLFLSGRAGSGAQVFTAGSRAITANVSSKIADVKGVFDVAKSEVRITAPLDVFKGLGGGIKTGTKLQLGELDQTASRFVAVNPATGADTAVFADVTTSVSSYTVGAPSCVVPGK